MLASLFVGADLAQLLFHRFKFGAQVSNVGFQHAAAAEELVEGFPVAVAYGQGLGNTRHFRAPNDFPFSKRNTPTVLNAAFNGLAADGSGEPTQAAMFWDSRAHSLETQSVMPVATRDEMRGHQYAESVALDSVVARLRGIRAYGTLFGAAFAEATPVTAVNMGEALAAFERTLLATDAPFDKYMRGDKTALIPQQVQGLNAFVASGCAKCHSGSILSDYQLYILGVTDNAKNAASDAGANGSYAFRTPSLRNVALTAPYMHSSTLPNLQAVLTFYDPSRGAAPSTRTCPPASATRRPFSHS